MRSIFLIAAVVLLCGLFLQPRGFRYYSPGILVPEPPTQDRLFMQPNGLEIDGYEITPLAEFKGEARVLASKEYWLGREAEISPIDLVLGWGPMSDERRLEKITFSQRNRFYFWQSEIPLAPYTIQYNSANMHIIPAHRLIKADLDALRPGDLIRFHGYLVDVNAEDGWSWESSTSRVDTGTGACELVWLRYVEVI